MNTESNAVPGSGLGSSTPATESTVGDRRYSTASGVNDSGYNCRDGKSAIKGQRD
jgi:hypothetical protein